MQQSYLRVSTKHKERKRGISCTPPRVQLRSLPFYIVAIWISVTSANPASKSSPFVPALQRAFTGRQCGNQHCCSIDSRMNVNMHILVEYSYVIKRRLIYFTVSVVIVEWNFLEDFKRIIKWRKSPYLGFFITQETKNRQC